MRRTINHTSSLHVDYLIIIKTHVIRIIVRCAWCSDVRHRLNHVHGKSKNNNVYYYIIIIWRTRAATVVAAILSMIIFLDYIYLQIIYHYVFDGRWFTTAKINALRGERSQYRVRIHRYALFNTLNNNMQITTRPTGVRTAQLVVDDDVCLAAFNFSRVGVYY